MWLWHWKPSVSDDGSYLSAPLLLPKAHKKQSNPRFCKNILLLQSFCSIIVNFSPFYPHTHNMSRIWACRNIRCFWVFPQKIIAKHRSLNWKKTSENNRYRWLNKNNRTDCDGKNVQKPSTSHRCYIKNIGIALLSKIDHCSSLAVIYDQLKQLNALVLIL